MDRNFKKIQRKTYKNTAVSRRWAAPQIVAVGCPGGGLSCYRAGSVQSNFNCYSPILAQQIATVFNQLVTIIHYISGSKNTLNKFKVKQEKSHVFFFHSYFGLNFLKNRDISTVFVAFCHSHLVLLGKNI